MGVLESLLRQQGPMMPPAKAPYADPTRLDSYRHADPTQMKGRGFLGPLQNKRGQTMTEYSISIPINGKEVEIPSLVPTLSQQEIQMILNTGQITEGMMQKARDHAIMRIQKGLPVFAE